MKHPTHLLLGVLASLLVILSACVALPPAANAPTKTSPVDSAALPIQPGLTALPPSAGTPDVPQLDEQAAPADPLSLCPAATDRLQRLVVPTGRYCLAYPAEYKVEQPSASEIVLVIGGLLDAANPRVHINVTDAAGGVTADTAADRVAAEFKDFKLDRTVRTVAGEPAVVLDRIPGQEINRRVLFVQDGLLYDLMFAPADPAAGDAFKGMEALQGQVLGSFAFLPAGVGIADDCLTPTGGTQLYRDPARGFCLLYPAGYSMQQTDASQAVFFSGSLMDVSKPKLFVRVEDANGQTAREMADAVAAEIERAAPGHKLDRPFGVTLGYEPAERLDNVPGQDIGRVLIAVHGPRALPASLRAG